MRGRSPTPSAATEANGPVAAELTFQEESRATVLLVFDDPLDTKLYGADLVRIRGDVTAQDPGETTVEISDLLGETRTATVTIGTMGMSEMIRGDVNADGDCTIVDAIKILEHLFSGGTVDCADAADMDDDGVLTIVDPLSLLTTLFLTGEPLDESCRGDSVADSLTCDLSGC